MFSNSLLKKASHRDVFIKMLKRLFLTIKNEKLPSSLDSLNVKCVA
jgi:hypothetical protein